MLVGIDTNFGIFFAPYIGLHEKSQGGGISQSLRT
jgi:hypothetical protein